MDILFKNDDFVFSYRVGGILIRNGKILLQRPKNDDYSIIDGVFHGYDGLDDKRIDLDFCWVPLEDLKNSVKVYPQELVPYVLEPKKEIEHFVSKQI